MYIHIYPFYAIYKLKAHYMCMCIYIYDIDALNLYTFKSSNFYL